MDELAKRFGELSDKYGPYVVDSARAAVRVEAFSTLAASILELVISIGCAWCAWTLYKRVRDDDWDEVTYVSIVILILVSFTTGILFTWAWLDPWTWVALTNPDLYLAKMVLKIK